MSRPFSLRSTPAAALALVLCALTVRLLPVPWVIAPVSRATAAGLAEDGSGVYLPLAESLAQGNGLAFSPGHPSASFMPLYPLYLAFLERLSLLSRIGLVVQQSLLGAALLVLIFIWVRSLLGARVASVATLLAAVLPDFAVYSYLNLSENLALLWVLLSLVAFQHAEEGAGRIGHLLTGVGVGVAGLTREFGVTFLVPLGLILVRRHGARRALSAIGAIVAGALLAFLPWIVRNALSFGEFIPLTDKGAINFYIGTLKSRYHLSDVRQQWVVEDEAQRRNDERLKNDLAGTATLSGRNRLYLAAAWRNISADPFGELRQVVRRIGFFWESNVGVRHAARFGGGPLFAASEVLYGATLIAALASCLWALPWRPPQDLAWMIIAWTFLFHLLVGEAEPRYHFVLLPAVFALAGVGVVSLLGRRPLAAPSTGAVECCEDHGVGQPCR